MKFLWDNKVKIIGVILAVHTQLMVELASYVTAGMVDPLTLRLVGTFGTLLSVGVTAAGFSNTTTEKVAEAKQEVAAAMKSAIEAEPPGKL